MPRSKGQYDPKWIEIFRWFEANPNRPYAIECGTRGRCNTLRTEFYRARSALQAAPVDGLELDNTLKRAISIEDTAVYFRTNDREPISELLSRSLRETQEKNTPRITHQSLDVINQQGEWIKADIKNSKEIK